jgi:ribosome-binding factor A
MPTRRQRQVSELIHRELSLLLMSEVRDPRVAGVTITAVDVTPDLSLARVFYSVLGGQEEVAEAQAGLERATGFLRSQLAGRVLLRLVPKLVFEYDRSAAYGQHIEELLDQLAQEERPADEPEPD